ncbi:hypothetical protein Taro_011048 [Colocasia esculenta]|uniref:Uncharacterized protein n=1 Tax=Colocasia esculenta TaxID=4460 RepID=A0A843U521_COLES|nr:hypothetical protein [Colocasia esculenta]
MFLCLFRASRRLTCVIALPGPPDPWAAIAKIGSSAWAEGRVLGSLQLVSLLSSGRARVGRRRRGGSRGPRN